MFIILFSCEGDADYSLITVIWLFLWDALSGCKFAGWRAYSVA